jgi:hypothetical protein
MPLSLLLLSGWIACRSGRMTPAGRCVDLKADTARQCRNRFFSRIPPASEASFFYSSCLGVYAQHATSTDFPFTGISRPWLNQSGWSDRAACRFGNRARHAGFACIAGASFAESGRFTHILRQDVVANGPRRTWRRPSKFGDRASGVRNPFQHREVHLVFLEPSARHRSAKFMSVRYADALCRCPVASGKANRIRSVQPSP